MIFKTILPFSRKGPLKKNSKETGRIWLKKFLLYVFHYFCKSSHFSWKETFRHSKNNQIFLIKVKITILLLALLRKSTSKLRLLVDASNINRLVYRLFVSQFSKICCATNKLPIDF